MTHEHADLDGMLIIATAQIGELRHQREQLERKVEALAAENQRLRGECYAWMNGVADAVEPYGFDRHAANGPADLLPGLRRVTAEVERLQKMAGAAVLVARSGVSGGEPLFARGGGPLSAIASRIHAGEPVSQVAEDYGVPIEDVEAVLRCVGVARLQAVADAARAYRQAEEHALWVGNDTSYESHTAGYAVDEARRKLDDVLAALDGRPFMGADRESDTYADRQGMSERQIGSGVPALPWSVRLYGEYGEYPGHAFVTMDPTGVARSVCDGFYDDMQWIVELHNAYIAGLADPAPTDDQCGSRYGNVTCHLLPGHDEFHTAPGGAIQWSDAVADPAPADEGSE